MKIENLKQKNVPFAIIKYNEYLKGARDESRIVVELIYLGHDGDLHREDVENKDIEFLIKGIDPIINTKNGRVWEFNNFKNKAHALHGKNGLKKKLNY